MTGIVAEYKSLERQTDADLVAMQCGDFYEFFDEAAQTVHDVIELEIGSKSSNGTSYPMAGVPVDKITPYLQTLVEHGYRVAVADQYEASDGGYNRSIERVVTPSTLIESSSPEPRYLATIVEEPIAYGLSFIDITTGQFYVGVFEGEKRVEELMDELYRFAPVEIIPGPTARNDDSLMQRIRNTLDTTITVHTKEAFAQGKARYELQSQFSENALETIGIDSTAEITAAGGALAYVSETGVGVKQSLTRLQRLRNQTAVTIDTTTQRNLELTETMYGESEGTVLDTINRTVTTGGYRVLREWLVQPTQDIDEINRRQECVQAFISPVMARDKLQETIDGVYDLQRLGGKAASQSLNPRELRSAIASLSAFLEIHEIVMETPQLQQSQIASILEQVDVDNIEQWHTKLSGAIVPDPPGTLNEGGVFKREYNDRLAEIVNEYQTAQQWVTTLEKREQNKTGITHLTVDRNQTDGYYIQVGNSEVDKIPQEYENVKSLKNSERYTTTELNEKERTILRLEDARVEKEKELYTALLAEIANESKLFQEVGRIVAELDLYAGAAEHAVHNDWVQPEVCRNGALQIENGRHPVVEQSTSFVPNSTYMGDSEQIQLITGPNMSGKSTYMRQVALITLLAQIGMFVPAENAEIPVVDGIYTRVGALDELSQGRSTFMVEMQELSKILHAATDDSLILLDEVGRGTATYDGISIAWAAIEYLHNVTGAKTLFATHYHELTALGDNLERVTNRHVTVDEKDGDIVFLYTVVEGSADKSYGVHVAELAGAPDPVVSRADEVLTELREDKQITMNTAETGAGTTESETQQVVFDTKNNTLRVTGNENQPTTAHQSTERDKANTDTNTGHDVADVIDELESINPQEDPPIEVVQEVIELQETLNT